MKKLIFLPLAFITLAAGAQSLTRKAAFKQGQQLERSTVVKMTFGMEMMGQSIDMNMENTSTTAVIVEKASAKDAAIKSTIKHVIFKMNGMGQEMEYDSDKPDNTNPLAQKLNEQVGKTTNVTVDSKGYITTSNDTSANAAGEKMGGFMGLGEEFAASAKKVGGTYDLVADLPVKGAKAGDKWADSSITESGRTVNHFTVLEVNGNQAVIGVEGEVAQKGQTEQNGMTIDMTMTGKTKGQYSYDTATGIIRKRTLVLDATGTMDVMGQSVPFTMKMDLGEGVTGQ